MSPSDCFADYLVALDVSVKRCASHLVITDGEWGPYLVSRASMEKLLDAVEQKHEQAWYVLRHIAVEHPEIPVQLNLCMGCVMDYINNPPEWKRHACPHADEAVEEALRPKAYDEPQYDKVGLRPLAYLMPKAAPRFHHVYTIRCQLCGHEQLQAHPPIFLTDMNSPVVCRGCRATSPRTFARPILLVDGSVAFLK